MHDWQHGHPRYRCQRCGEIVSATTGTAYAGIRTDLEVYRRGVKALAEGVSIRATGRLVEADKDTVNHWLPILGRHSQDVMNYFFRNLHLEECQLDELWTFIYKKEKQLTALEKVAEVYGDAWVWIAFSPVCKLVPAWVVGKRTLPHARRLVFRLKSATDGQIPFLPATNYLIMRRRFWKCTENKYTLNARERVDAFRNLIECRLQIYAMQSLSKNVSRVE